MVTTSKTSAGTTSVAKTGIINDSNISPSKPAASTTGGGGGSSKKTSTTKKKTARKKKSTSKPKTKSNASTANAVNQLDEAKSLYKKLINEKDAKFHDAAWLSTIPTHHPNHPLNTTPPSFLESDLDIVQNALKDHGLSCNNITAQAFGCLLESARKHALELLNDATDYAMLSSMDDVTPADLYLAQDMQSQDCINSKENLDVLVQISDETNRILLPPIPDHCYNGVVLPSAEYNLLGRTFDVMSRPPRQGLDATESNNSISHKKCQAVTSHVAGNGAVGTGSGYTEGNETKRDETTSNFEATKKNDKPSYGAKRGPQIGIKLSSSSN
mmetsp:Transcript_8680/g.9542  ORF Transcript_8680/g.9542 Transcript_8680/m.9542 type:complete len:328 (+) Transcript_8680:1-984(+)